MVLPARLEDHALIAARRLRRAIVCQLGLASLLVTGCRTTLPVTDEGGVTTNQSSNGESPDSGQSSEGEVTSDVDTGMPDESGSTDDEDEGGDETTKCDFGFYSDLPQQPSCWTQELTEAEVVAAHPDCALGPFDPILGISYSEICVQELPDGACADICPPSMLCEGMQDCALSWHSMCGPYQMNHSCCLILAAEAGSD
jgi:hypothetical protein